MSGHILILGAAGRCGHAAAEAFRDAGWSVASLVRPGAAARAAARTQIVEANALDGEAVIKAAHGSDLVLHALNPPYTDWSRLALPLADVAVAAAQAAGATLLLPGNLYNYGAAMPPTLDEDTPMRPSSRKGAIRVRIEERLREAASSGLRVIVLRAGDFYGGGGTGSWFDRILVKDLAHGRVTYPGPLDVVHEWAYLPDFAVACVRLAEARGALSSYETFGFPGHAVTGREFVRVIARAMGRDLRVSRMPWWLLRAAGPLVPIFRELAELAYLWQTPHRIAGDKLEDVIGDIPRTPLAEAVAAALRALGFRTRL
ncbi:MAG TPA: NAD-dependent epimerase/dehydratase family protein [Xanthobacteraceae bacterium]|nr:NAD-dependent epimerase/dehydratase family protein [Xanthobacteraceae bacterium]